MSPQASILLPMGRIKKNRGSRSGQERPLHWTPLRQECGCVVEWGWDSEKISPPAFIEWCMAMISAPCVWHGAETGIEIPLDQKTVSLRTPKGLLFTQRAEGAERRELGLELTRQANELGETLKLDDVSGLHVGIPAKYQRIMRAKGLDPLETWLDMRMTDIFLNLGQAALTAEMIEMLPEPKA